MKGSSRAWLALLTSFAVLATGSTCDPATTAIAVIRYEQVGACRGTVVTTGSPGGLVSAGAGAAFVAFRINSIQNTDAAARDFDFDPNRLFINEDPRIFVSTGHASSLQHPFATYGMVVSAGTTASVNGVVFAIVDDSTVVIDNPGQQIGTIGSYWLYHDTQPGSQGVLLVNERLGVERFPFRGDCQNLTV